MKGGEVANKILSRRKTQKLKEKATLANNGCYILLTTFISYLTLQGVTYNKLVRITPHYIQNVI